jgi:hypothetical protein
MTEAGLGGGQAQDKVLINWERKEDSTGDSCLLQVRPPLLLDTKHPCFWQIRAMAQWAVCEHSRLRRSWGEESQEASPPGPKQGVLG